MTEICAVGLIIDLQSLYVSVFYSMIYIIRKLDFFNRHPELLKIKAPAYNLPTT